MVIILNRINLSLLRVQHKEQRLVALVAVINTPPPGHFKCVRAWISYRFGCHIHSSALAIKVLKRRLRQLAKVLGLD
jgi:hypothetical protein